MQRNLGAVRAAAFDIEAACSGFVYALDIASHFVASHTYNTVLVIGAEKDVDGGGLDGSQHLRCCSGTVPVPRCSRTVLTPTAP